MVDKVVFLQSLANAVTRSTGYYNETDQANQAVENNHAHAHTCLTLQIVVIPLHPIIALTFPRDCGTGSSEPGGLIGRVEDHIVLQTEKVPVQPAAVSCSPAQHPVLRLPAIPVINVEVEPIVAPLGELFSRLGQL